MKRSSLDSTRPALAVAGSLRIAEKNFRCETLPFSGYIQTSTYDFVQKSLNVFPLTCVDASEFLVLHTRPDLMGIGLTLLPAE